MAIKWCKVSGAGCLRAMAWKLRSHSWCQAQAFARKLGITRVFNVRISDCETRFVKSSKKGSRNPTNVSALVSALAGGKKELERRVAQEIEKAVYQNYWSTQDNRIDLFLSFAPEGIASRKVSTWKYNEFCGIKKPGAGQLSRIMSNFMHGVTQL